MAMPTLPTQHTQTHTAHTLAPSAAGGPGTTWTHGVKTETYESASPEIKALIRQLNRLAQAQTLEEHQAALQGFDEDVTLDTPFIQVQGRERIRVLATLAKIFLGSFEIEPKLVKITVPEGVTAKGGKLDVDGMVHWLPHRPWYLPLTLLLPKDVPIFADVSLGIKAHNDKVFFVSGKNHNLPHVPRLLRVIAGWVAGMAVSVAEPAVISLMDWYRAGVENVQGARTQIGSGLEGGQQTAARAAGTIRETAENVIETAQEKVSQATKAAETFATKVAHTVTGSGTTATTTPTTTTVA